MRVNHASAMIDRVRNYLNHPTSSKTFRLYDIEKVEHGALGFGLSKICSPSVIPIASHLCSWLLSSLINSHRVRCLSHSGARVELGEKVARGSIGTLLELFIPLSISQQGVDAIT